MLHRHFADCDGCRDRSCCQRTDAFFERERHLPCPRLPAPRQPWPRRSASSRKRRLACWTCGSRASAPAGSPKHFITDDTESIAADAQAAVKGATADLARQAKRYEKLSLPPDVARKFMLLKLSVDIPAPRGAAAQAELAKIAVSLDGDYGRGNLVPGRQKRKLQAVAGHRKNSGQQPRSAGTAERMEWLAQHLSAHAQALRPPGRAFQSRRARNGFCRYGRDVALQLRHASG